MSELLQKKQAGSEAYMMPEHYLKLFQNKLFREIMDNIDDAVLIIDKELNVVFVNSSYEQMFHLEEKGLIGKKLAPIDENVNAAKVVKTGNPVIHAQEFLKAANMDSIGESFPLKYNGEIVGGISVFNNVLKYSRLLSRLKRSEEMNKYLQEQLSDLAGMQHSQEFITVHPHMKQVLGLAVKVARSEATVMIRGESGTGKEVMAKIIHDNSPRRDGPFVKVNCAAIPDNLLESELFGYAGGAFTGAKKEGKAGKFEMAQGGTIFLDEIGDMDINMQVKILRVIQEREVERIGSNRVISLDVRIVAATNQNLEELIQSGKFRQDLYYRLNVIELDILPLRERREDISLLVHFLMQKMAGEELDVTPEAMNILYQYDWPGNVRELQNVIEHACILRSSNIVTTHELPVYMRPDIQREAGVQEKPGNYDLKEMTENLERNLIYEALRKFSNKSEAIKKLGISRSSFYEKIKKYHIDIEGMEIE